jgi:WD40 repeat protein
MLFGVVTCCLVLCVDFKWYPQMSLSSPSSCCFITCSRDHPVQLWDLHSNSLRASYLGHNHLDELESSNSVAFSAQGDKIFSGANRMIKSVVVIMLASCDKCSAMAVSCGVLL